MLDEFRTYLQKHEYAKTTIDGYCIIAGKFENWCNTKGYDVENINYNKWSEYQNLIKNQITTNGVQRKDNTIEHIIGVIRLFFDYLVHDDFMILNPIKEIYYKSNSEFHHQALTEDELHELYYCFPTLNLQIPMCESAAIRNKVIVGLVVFQGIESAVFKNLTLDCIDLSKNKIYVPGTKRSNGRTLDLKQTQISVLRQYIEHDRAILQKKINCYTEALFPLNSTRYSSMFNDICKKLKTINLKVTNFRQIRFSVISIWVKKYDLRKVQIMAGHRFISSTEKYLKIDLDSLQQATQMYHPMQ